MDLSNAEWFLLVWACGFTFLSGVLLHKLRETQVQKIALFRTLVGVGLGKIKYEVMNGAIKFHEVEEEQTKE